MDEVCVNTSYFSKIDLEKQLLNKHKKAIEKVLHKIHKRIVKNPYKPYIKISSKEFTHKEMRAIKLIFERKYFKILFEKPKDDMVEIRHYITTSGSIGGVTYCATNSNISTSKAEKVFKEKFYICW